MSLVNRRYGTDAFRLTSAFAVLPAKSALPLPHLLVSRKGGSTSSSSSYRPTYYTAGTYSTALTGAQIAIIVSSIVGFVILCIVLFILYSRRKKIKNWVASKKASKIRGAGKDDDLQLGGHEVKLVDGNSQGLSHGIGDARSSFTEEADERRDKDIEEDTRLMGVDDAHDGVVVRQTGENEADLQSAQN
jgi:hypothetical protein